MEQVKTTVQPSPESIIQMGLGFWASKILLTAVKLELFTILGDGKKMAAHEIKLVLQLHSSDRNVFDFLDTLTGLGFLQRDGVLNDAQYSNALNTNFFLDKRKPSYIGGILEMANNRLYDVWGKLEDALRTGKSQNGTMSGDEEHAFDGLYSSPEKLKEFINAMSGVQAANFKAFAQKFDFSSYKTLADIGGSGALLSISVALQQPHMDCVSFDLPAVEPIALQNIADAGLADTVKTASGDFFTGNIPKADVIVMGNILHDWDEEKKLLLMQKAYAALPDNGAFVAIENVIDDERRQNVFGLMMSLNMLVETGKGFDYTFADFNKWANMVGFRKIVLMPLTGPTSAVVAYK